MDKPKIIGLGLNGLVGSRITELLKDDFDFIPLSRSTGVDITKKETLSKVGEFKDADFVLHMAAKTDVDGCEQDKGLGEEGEAWKINVLGTQNVARVCSDFGKKIVYFSTDFVFDGNIAEGEKYNESNTPNPLGWYAKTKYEGEKRVEESGADYIIIRLAFPYRADFEKTDFVRTLKNMLEEGKNIQAVTDEHFTPTFIDDVAWALKTLVQNDEKGIYHVCGGVPLSSYEAANQIARIFDLDKGLIGETTREEFFRGRAPRPFNSALENAKIGRLGVNMKSFEEGLLEIKSQLK